MFTNSIGYLLLLTHGTKNQWLYIDSILCLQIHLVNLTFHPYNLKFQISRLKQSAQVMCENPIYI